LEQGIEEVCPPEAKRQKVLELGNEPDIGLDSLAAASERLSRLEVSAELLEAPRGWAEAISTTGNLQRL
jgi:hypothetical protein